jgi:membrane protease YdiL (CAAX protease family)
MFLENTVKSPNLPLKYLLGFFIIALFYVIGQIPLGIGLVLKSVSSGQPIPTTNDAIMKVFSQNTTLFLMLLIFVFTMMGIIIVVKYLHKLRLKDIITIREKVDWKRIFFAFCVWGLFSLFSALILYYISPENFVFNFKPFPFIILLLISMTMLPIQTSTEEFIFRGYLMQGIGILTKKRWAPLFITSFAFGLMHIMNPEIEKMGYIVLVYYIGTGFFLGIITLMDDGMELALGFHAANNIVAALLVSSEWSALQTNSVFKDVSEPSVGFEILVPVFIIFPLLLFIFSKKYKWSNWKEKLTGSIEFKALKTTQKIENYE